MLKNSLLALIGNTPIVHLNKLSQECDAILVAKLEMFNPISVKDRPVFYMIEEAEKQGLINKNTTIIEATSGNTGIALAFICAIKRYRLIICMNKDMSEERKRILRIFGAELELNQMLPLCFQKENGVFIKCQEQAQALCPTSMTRKC